MSERRQAASWIADEYGGSYLNNPAQQNRDLAAANDMAILIQQMVRDRGGGEAGYRRAGELINETLDELRARAPFGFVTPAFALGTTQVLLEKANTMDGPQFLQYLEGIRDRDNPLFFWQRATLDPLFDEVKERTRAHVEEVYGRSTFTVFDALKGQRGPIAFSAGAADAVLDEVGTGGRSLILGASNPVEAGRQAVDMLRNLDRVPQALQQQVREAQQLIQAAGLDDYHKGFLTVRVAFIALDAADVVEAGLSIGNLARRLRNGEINNIGDAIRALDEGPQVMRQRGQAGDANDLAAGDVPARTRTPTASPSAQAATLTNQLVEGLPANYREPYREAFTQLLRTNNYDTPEEVAGFARWLNDNPDHAVTRQYHEIAQQTMQQRVVSAYPDRVEFAYQRALDDTFRDAGLTTPQQRMGYMDAFNGPNAAAFRTALDERALTHVVDNSLRQIPENVRDAYRGSLASILSEQGYLGQGRFDPDGAQQYINNLAGAPGGPSAMAVHNRAMNIVVNGAVDRFPDGTEAYYARAYRQTFEAENVRDPSAGQRYIDNLDAAPNGPAMRAVHNRAIGAIVDDVVDSVPQNLQPAYARALRLSLDAAGKDSPQEVLDYVRNLTDGRQVQSVAALHQRAFDSVMQSAVSSIDEPSRAAYAQALRESLDAGGSGPARNADGSQAWDYGSVERLQQYVVDLSASPQTMQRIHDRADELLGRSRTPDQTPPVQTPPQDRVDPPNNTQPPVQPPLQDRVDPPNNNQPPTQNPPPNDRQAPDPDQPRLNPSSQPNDPLLPFHAVERDQRMRAPEPLVAPNGQRFDVMGVDDEGRLRLRPEGQRVDALPAEAMFEMRATTPQALAESGNPVMYGREPWLTAGRNENGIVLRDPQNAERTTVVPDARAAEIFTPVGREVTYQGETLRFQALQSPGWQPGVDRRGFQLVDPDNPERTVFVPENRAVDIRMRLGEDGEYRFGDVRHGVIRMRPMEPDREISMPLQPGMTFEARLRDREMEGPYRIAVGDNGELTATGRIRNGTEVTQRIEPSDIAPRYVDVRSPDFNDSFQVDSFIHREANTRNRAISTEPTGLPLRDPAFGNLDGTPSPQLALGAQSLQSQADFIRRNAGNLDAGQAPSLTVFNIAFNNQGEARQVLDAMSDFRQMHPDAPIRIVAYEPSFRSFEGRDGFDELQRIIQRDRIQVEFFGNDPAQREVIHAKGVAVNDQVLFSTGAVIDGSSQKADISVPLPPDAARAFNAYLNEAVIGDASVARRQELTANAAREGVLINDPEARLPYIARAQDGLIRGAERELTVSVSELRNPETTRAIIERAEAGVNVQVQFREMDPESRRLLAEAQQRLPNLKVEDASAWQPRPHYNVIIADREQAYVGTAYLWQNQQDMLQHGRSFENGVLLQGDAVQRLQAQMEALRSLQPANPGQRLLNPAPDDAPDVGVRLRNETTGSISISAPPGSSIGVDVRDSTVNGSIQTVSGSGNVQVAGDGLRVDGRTVRPDANGNVQVTDGAGLGITLNNPGTSGNGDTTIRLDGSRVDGSVQSAIGTGNVQISGNGNDVRIDTPVQDPGNPPGAGGDRTPIRVENDQTLRGEISNGNNNVSVVGRDNHVDVQQSGTPVRDPRTDRSVSIAGDVADSTITTGNENVAVIGSENRVGVAASDRQVAVDGGAIRVDPRADSAQSIVGDRNTQIDAGEARINGDRRQTVTGGDDNVQTQNLGANVTAGSVTQTIDGRSGSRQQIGDDVPSPQSSAESPGDGASRSDRDRRALPPASQPDDPLLPFHAVPRGERMQPPDPIVVAGRSYDVLGMNANGELQLRPPTDNVRTVPDNAMFVLTPTTATDLRPGADVVYSGRTWRMGEPVEAGQSPGVTERSYRLIDPHNEAATALVPESNANAIFRRAGREVTYDDRTWEFGAATGRGYVLIDPANRENTRTVPLDEADQIRMRFAGGTEYTLQGLKNGVLRVAPSEPTGDLSYRPSAGETFEARLNNRELEGVYTIRVGENGELTASGRIRNGTEVTERIQPSDIAPRYASVDSPDFNQRFQVDAFLHREAETRARSIATEPTDLPVRDPNLGAMSETVRPQVLRGVDGLDAQADFIRRHAGEVAPGSEPRLTVFNIGFSNQGEAQRVVDAMVDFRREHPDARIEVVAERTRFESASRAPGYDAFLQTLRDNDVQLNFFENGDTSRQVIHAKGVIVNDQVLFTTGAVIDGSKNKVDIATELPPDAARSFIRFFDQGINGNADPATRQQMLADMSRQGVLVDDPVTRTPYISRTQDALIQGAENKLFVSLSDLTNPDTTRAIIDRVGNGVNVEIQYREMDPTSRQLLDQAMQQYPDRLRVENISNWDPRSHYNVIVADDRQGYVGTSYLWPNQQQQIHHTRSFENGVLLQGESVRQLVDQLDELRRSQQPDLRSNAQTSDRVDGLSTPPGDAARIALDAPAQSAREPGLDDPRHPNHTMFASALERIQAFERGRGIDSGEFGRNLAGDLTVRAVEAGLPQISHVAFNAEGTRAFAVDTQNLDAEWRRVAYTDVASAGQQSLAASSERLRESQAQAMLLQPTPQPAPDEQARSGARMV